jgi:hypothetical protein
VISDTTVSIVSGFRLQNMHSIPGRGTEFVRYHHIQTGLDDRPICYGMSTGFHFPGGGGGKSARSTYLNHPFIALPKIAWSSKSSTPKYFVVSWCPIKHKRFIILRICIVNLQKCTCQLCHIGCSVRLFSGLPRYLMLRRFGKLRQRIPCFKLDKSGQFTASTSVKVSIIICFTFMRKKGERCSVVVKALCYKPEGRGFDTLWGDFIKFT